MSAGMCTQTVGGAHTMRCAHSAVWTVTWSESVDDGWTVTTRRDYCSAHADRVRSMLEERGVSSTAEPVRSVA